MRLWGAWRTAVALAAGCDDATKAALALCEHAALFHVDRIGLFFGARYRLAGLLDHDPSDPVTLATMGLVSLASLEDVCETPGWPGSTA